MIVGSDGSRYSRIMKDLHYEVSGHSGMIRDFYGKLYDNNKFLGDVVDGNIFLPDCTWIRKEGNIIFTRVFDYELKDDTLISPAKIWFELEDDWDAMRIVLKDITDNFS